ncbi:MAG: hypothetical protein HC869_19735 [Rhodospirillales bacterium]|nr:hypothetical protein [Rhodospirillales bacterium]
MHEIKFDGWRVQLHKNERRVAIYAKGGYDVARRFPALALMVAADPVASCIIDGELTVPNQRGIPDFHALHFRDRDDELCVWAFDLLHFNGMDRDQPTAIQAKIRAREAGLQDGRQLAASV